jgi:hypothetical protein
MKSTGFPRQGTIRTIFVGNDRVLADSTTALNEGNEFIFTAAPDPAGVLQVLERSAEADVWLIIRYTF